MMNFFKNNAASLCGGSPGGLPEIDLKSLDGLKGVLGPVADIYL